MAAEPNGLALGIITVVFSFLGTVFSGIMAYLMARLNQKQTKQDKQLTIIAETGEKTHQLCNSAMLEQKRIYAVKCEAANVADPTAANKAEAIAAREAYEDHKRKQERMER